MNFKRMTLPDFLRCCGLPDQYILSITDQGVLYADVVFNIKSGLNMLFISPL